MVHAQQKATDPRSKDLRKKGGVFLKDLRRTAQLTQRELAEAIGLDYYTFISQIETGQARLPPHLYVKAANALGVDQAKFARKLMWFYDPDTYAAIWNENPSDDLSVKIAEAKD